MKQLDCQTCGAPLQIENQFIRAVTCQFCGASYMVSGSDNLETKGTSAKLADYPSRLDIGQTGVIQGRGFQVLGRIRYTYDEGFWEEWQISWNDEQAPSWLEEDEGYWTLYKRERVRSAIPAPEQIRVGSTIDVNGSDMFVTEKRTARMLGSEGQFSMTLPLAGDFTYIEGTANGQAASVTFWQNEIEVEFGTDLEPHEIKIS